MHSEYIEQLDGGYYDAGTRISLDSVVYAFNEGLSPEALADLWRDRLLSRSPGQCRRVPRSC